MTRPAAGGRLVVRGIREAFFRRWWNLVAGIRGVRRERFVEFPWLIIDWRGSVLVAPRISRNCTLPVNAENTHRLDGPDATGTTPLATNNGPSGG